MRATIGIYRTLGTFIEEMDAAYAASTSSPNGTPSNSDTSLQAPLEDPSIDCHFRSGVYLGIGMSNIILSLMPGKLATLVELFGYKGDRKLGLKSLMRAGGWGDGQQVVEPSELPHLILFSILNPTSAGIAEEGVRRTICDMSLLIFHLVLSSFTFDGVDIAVAQRVLDFNMKRYPNGILLPPPTLTPFLNVARCVLPFWCRTSRAMSLAAQTGDYILHTSDGGTITV
jgi:hypothetical protein